jgi:hypothetical protein
MKVPLRSSWRRPATRSCNAAPSANRLPPKINPPSISGDTITMPDTMMPVALQRLRHLGGAKTRRSFAQKILGRVAAAVLAEVGARWSWRALRILAHGGTRYRRRPLAGRPAGSD